MCARLRLGAPPKGRFSKTVSFVTIPPFLSIKFREQHAPLQRRVLVTAPQSQSTWLQQDFLNEAL